jgi:hypothetical protein
MPILRGKLGAIRDHHPEGTPLMTGRIARQMGLIFLVQRAVPDVQPDMPVVLFLVESGSAENDHLALILSGIVRDLCQCDVGIDLLEVFARERAASGDDGDHA